VTTFFGLVLLAVLAVMGVHNYNSWQDCKDKGGEYVHVFLEWDGYSCVKAR
jgi:hypothetical protein